jgi:hypothetical protein
MVLSRHGRYRLGHSRHGRLGHSRYGRFLGPVGGPKFQTFCMSQPQLLTRLRDLMFKKVQGAQESRFCYDIINAIDNQCSVCVTFIILNNASTTRGWLIQYMFGSLEAVLFFCIPYTVIATFFFLNIFLGFLFISSYSTI